VDTAKNAFDGADVVVVVAVVVQEAWRSFGVNLVGKAPPLPWLLGHRARVCVGGAPPVVVVMAAHAAWGSVRGVPITAVAADATATVVVGALAARGCFDGQSAIATAMVGSHAPRVCVGGTPPIIVVVVIGGIRGSGLRWWSARRHRRCRRCRDWGSMQLRAALMGRAPPPHRGWWVTARV